MHSRQWILLSALLAGCGGSVDLEPSTEDAGADSAVGPTLGAACSAPGMLGCQGIGQKLQLLCDGTKWISNGICSRDLVCDPRPGPTLGSCQPPCGKSTCEGATLVTCGADRLSLVRTECASEEHCKQSPGSACAKCLSWDMTCDGAKLMRCAPDHQSFVLKQTCASEALCNAAGGTCKEPVCTVGEYRCRGDALDACNSAGSDFEFVKLCPAGTCNALGKECTECKSGDTTCVGSTPRACDSTGRWKDLATCSGATPFCIDGACSATLCAAGQTRCTGDTLETCNASLTGWDVVKACAPGYCNAALKQCDDCKLGDVSCNGDTPRTCDSTLRWKDLSPCSAATPTCVAGACVAVGWFDMADPSALPFAARQEHTAIWTGTSMIVWGGKVDSTTYSNEGASYDPVTNTWSSLSPAPLSGRVGHAAVWTGKEMIIWGGQGATGALADGAIYEPSTKIWWPMPSGPTARSHFASAWSPSTNELLVWGGLGSSGAVATGSRFNITTKTWSPMSVPFPGLTARSSPGAVWTASTMVIFGGRGCSSGYCSDSAAYNPVSDSWSFASPSTTDLDPRTSVVAIATGSSSKDATFWGGFGLSSGGSEYRNNGATFMASTASWKSITPPTETVLANAKRASASAWWAGDKLYVWGGTNGTVLGNGAAYDPTTDTWTTMPTKNAPSARSDATAVWTGTAAIVWGGSPFKHDGRIFKP